MNERDPRRAPPPPDAAVEDTALRTLSKDERARLGIDSWEPSLLRQLLEAHNRFRQKNKS